MKILIFLLSLFFLEVHPTSHFNPTTKALPETIIQESHYQANSSSRVLPYFYIKPSSKPSGMLIYMHGAGGKYEQGMSDDLFRGNFKTLKGILAEKNYLYLTPETSNFEQKGARELVDLIEILQKEHPDIPLYLSGASAGGRTVFYALEELQKRKLDIQGVILICPALSDSQIETVNQLATTPTWIEVGEKDSIINAEKGIKLREVLEKAGFKVKLEIIENGDHNAPVEKIHWGEALNFFN